LVAAEAEVEVAAVAEAREEEAEREAAATGRQPEVVAVRAVAPGLREAAPGQPEEGEVEAAPVRAMRAPVVAADFVAELPAALEAAEAPAVARGVESAAAIDRQLCHLAAMSLETGRVGSEIGPEASADREALQIGRAALAVPAAREELQIDRAVSVAWEALAIDPELGIGLVSGPVLEPALEQGLVLESQIDLGSATAHSSEIALGTAAIKSAIVATSRTTGVTVSATEEIALRIAVIVLKTVRKTEVTASKTVAIVLITVEIASKIAVTDLKTAVIG
jgi:hypothetical protein